MDIDFEAKIKKCLNKFFGIGKPDYTRHELSFYADFVELTSFFSGQDGVTRGDIQDNFFGEKNYQSIESRDQDEAFLITIFDIIEERQSLFGTDYAFNYSVEHVLTVKKELTLKNKLYLSLLISSKLNLFSVFNNELTADFEAICFWSLKNYLPNNAIVKNFGINTEYSGTASEKIRKLATDLGLKIEEDDLSEIGERNVKERGLDVVGWIPFEDNCRSKLIFLCQCACGKDFEAKQHDTRRFMNYLQFYRTSPQHTLFIPYSLINVRKGKFYHSDYIEDGYLIFERKRIIQFYENDCFNNTASCRIVDKILDEGLLKAS